MSDPVLWRCLFNGSEELTVGKIFQLHCEGSLGVPLKENLKLELPKELPPFSLVLLKVVNKDPTSFDLNVVSYRAGQFKVPYIRVSDGDSQIESTELEWTVSSVLQQDSKPIPPKGPFFLEIPLSVIYLSVALLCSLFFVSGFFFWRHRKKSALNADLEKHHSHLPPFRQFESSLRAIRNKLVWNKELKSEEKEQVLSQLDESLRTYFLRTLKIRAHSMGRKSLVKTILRYGNKKDSKTWTGYFKELESSKSKSNQLDSQALLQMVEMASALVMKFENLENRERVK